MTARALTVAGSDSGGGAGIQADLKTFMAYGVYGMSAITAVTAQNTLGVDAVAVLDPDLVSRQILRVSEDIGVDAVKVGMCYSAPIVEAVGAALAVLPPVPVVWDPVLQAKDGTALLDEGAWETLKRVVAAVAAVVTPNLPEAEAWVGFPVKTPAAMEEAAREILKTGVSAVLLKGGHLENQRPRDLLAWAGGIQWFEAERVAGRHTHGTGCTLSSAIAAGLARGFDLPRAVAEAKRYVTEAIRHAPGVGAGHGPLDHGWGFSPWI